MHDLAVCNQEDALSPAEKDELFAYARAGTVLSILKADVRRALKIKPQIKRVQLFSLQLIRRQGSSANLPLVWWMKKRLKTQNV